MKLRFLPVLFLLAMSSAAPAQVPQQFDPEYLENIYGPIRDVSLSDLVFSSESYSGRGIRV